VRAQGNERGEIGHGIGLLVLRDPDEAVRVEVVPEQERRVRIVGLKEAADWP
jgi:hypothetical protein